MHRYPQLLLLGLLVLAGCAGIPKGIEPVEGFQANRYLGRWYEIARLDHSFERGLTHVTAEYTRRDDGGIDVVNRGYKPETAEWKEARGKAYFVEDESIGRLKVTFFWPFYGGYNIIDLAEDYSYSMVCGPSRSYLWILSRDRTMDDETYARLVEKARSLDFKTGELILVEQVAATAERR